MSSQPVVIFRFPAQDMPSFLMLLGSAVVLGLLVCQVIYNCFFHPLRSFPGPRLWATSRLPYVFYLWQGELHECIKHLHDEYGPVVRIAPDELSFTLDAAWHDIYCGGTANKGFPKHNAYRNAQTFESLFDASDDNHSRLRRLLKADFFSIRAVRRQERQVQAYADRLVDQLRTHHCSNSSRHGVIGGRGGGGSKPEDAYDKAAAAALQTSRLPPADLREWYNFATFDIIGSVALGEDFGCLDGLAYHPWILMVLTHFKMSALLMCLRFYPPLPALMARLAPPQLLRLQDTFLRLVREKVGRRLGRDSTSLSEPDFVTAATATGDSDALSREELEANTILLLLAGSETIATSLLSATHLLCENPVAMRRLTAEVRAGAPAESDLSAAHIEATMPYLNAVLRETHRLCPPLANGPARVVGDMGAVIAGYVVPPGTAVAVTQYAANRSAANFTRADEFLPERWLSPEQAAKYHTTKPGPTEDGAAAQLPPQRHNEQQDWHQQFATDVRSVVKPFSIGGRDCLGQNLAWAEFRVLLARMVWNFDFEVCGFLNDSSTSAEEGHYSAFARWTDQKAFMLWQKESYCVSLKVREEA